jgi:hypothetical protein
MAAPLNHTSVWLSDQMKSATFLAEMLGRLAPTRVAHFDVVELRQRRLGYVTSDANCD